MKKYLGFPRSRMFRREWHPGFSWGNQQGLKATMIICKLTKGQSLASSEMVVKDPRRCPPGILTCATQQTFLCGGDPIDPLLLLFLEEHLAYFALDRLTVKPCFD